MRKRMLSRQNQAWHVAGALLYHRALASSWLWSWPLEAARARSAEPGPCLSSVKCCDNLVVSSVCPAVVL